MKQSRIIVAGIGPGNEADITPAVISALQESDVVVGYKYYFQFVTPHLRPETECIDTGMKRERTRAEQAFELAEEGKTVCVISSGDAGIYGMTPLIYEMKRERNSTVEIVSLPGISAFQKAASLLGAPVGHDFCAISLSDLMTPWERIEKRIIAAAVADFVTAVYNPKSEGRYWQLYRLKELFLQEGRMPETPVGYVRQAGRPEQEVHITTLENFNPEEVDLLNPENYALISPNLFRVQKFAYKNYVFRHHLETTIKDTSSTLKGITWTDFRSSKGLDKIVKVRVDHIGQIVSIGEY